MSVAPTAAAAGPVWPTGTPYWTVPQLQAMGVQNPLATLGTGPGGPGGSDFWMNIGGEEGHQLPGVPVNPKVLAYWGPLMNGQPVSPGQLTDQSGLAAALAALAAYHHGNSPWYGSSAFPGAQGIQTAVAAGGNPTPSLPDFGSFAGTSLTPGVSTPSAPALPPGSMPPVSAATHASAMGGFGGDGASALVDVLRRRRLLLG